MIDTFAERFGLDPDAVYETKSFDTVIKFAWLWREQDEYRERYESINRMMNESAMKNK